MIVSVFNGLKGKYQVMDLDVTMDKLLEWQDGELVQDVFPHLSTEEREFLITGMLPDEQI